MAKFLVLAGDKKGINMFDDIDLKFREIKDAIFCFDDYLIKYGRAAMFEVKDNKLILIRQKNRFE